MMSVSRLLVLPLAAAALAACASPAPPPGALVEARTPSEIWQPQVEIQPTEIRLAVHAQGLSPSQSDALGVFAADWRAAGGHGPVTLRAPVGGPEPGAVSQASEAVRVALGGLGVPASAIRIVGYEANGAANAPLIVGRDAYAVTIPACGRDWTNIAHSANNQVQPNFGCAVTANMAAQIANPADLRGPSATTPADAARRSTVLDKYRKGEPTASARDDQATGAVSQVVK